MSIDPGYLAGVAQFGSPDYYALLFSGKAEREDIRVLLALEHHLGQISSLSPEPQVRQAKLGWWASELDRLSQGKPVHPVTAAVQEVLSRRRLSPSPMLELFTAIVREVHDDWPATPEELLEHAQKRGAVIGLIADTLTRPANRGPDYAEPFEVLGRARFVALCLGADHRCQTPAHGHSDADTVSQATLLVQLAAGQRRALDEALQTLPAGERSRYVPLLVMAALVRARLAAMVEDKENRGPSQLSTLIQAWRSARAASRGKLAR